MNVSDAGEGTIDRVPPPTTNVSGIFKEAKPAAFTARLAVYVPGWLSKSVSVVTSYPTEIASPLTISALVGKSVAALPVGGVSVTVRAGELPSLAVTMTVTAGGSCSPELY